MANTITINCNNYPYTGGKASITFYRLTEDVVDDIVPDGIMPGNYRIGRLKDQKFKIIYVGRVDDREDDGLKDRIKEHIGENGKEIYGLIGKRLIMLKQHTSRNV